MRSFIITGNLDEREKYIHEFIANENISSHLVTFYNDEIKAKEARLIRSELSKKFSDKRLIIISSKLTLVAQNILLKSFEELPDNVTVILSQNDLSEIIETMQSRFFILKLNSSEDSSYSLEELLSDDRGKRLMIIDKFINENKDESIDTQVDLFIASYRRALLENIDSDLLHQNTQKLKRLIKVSNLIKNNNLNLRLGLENVFI